MVLMVVLQSSSKWQGFTFEYVARVKIRSPYNDPGEPKSSKVKVVLNILKIFFTYA